MQHVGLSQHTRESDLEFGYWARLLANFVQRGEVITGKTQTDLIEAMRRIVREVVDKGNGRSEVLLPSFPEQRIGSDEWRGSLFVFAIYHGLSLYVEEMLRDYGTEIIAMSGKGLLHCAIRGYDREPYNHGLYFGNNHKSSSHATYCKEPYSMKHHIRIIQALLSHGVHPNEELESETAWQCALLRCYGCDPTDLGALGQILKLMILYGADPNVAMPTSHSALATINSTFVECAPRVTGNRRQVQTAGTPYEQRELDASLQMSKGPGRGTSSGLDRLGRELAQLLASSRAEAGKVTESRSAPAIEWHPTDIKDTYEFGLPAIVPSWLGEVLAAMLLVVLKLASHLITIPPTDDTHVASQSNDSFGISPTRGPSQNPVSIPWCTQRVLRYMDCQCLYRREKVRNLCHLYKLGSHNIKENIMLLELLCPAHSQPRGADSLLNVHVQKRQPAATSPAFSLSKGN